jgi:hypothetical protein
MEGKARRSTERSRLDGTSSTYLTLPHGEAARRPPAFFMRASLDAVADSEKLILSPTSHDMTLGICAVVKDGRAAKVEVVTFVGAKFGCRYSILRP